MVELFIRCGTTRTLMYDEVDNAGNSILHLALEGETDMDSPVVRMPLKGSHPMASPTCCLA